MAKCYEIEVNTLNSIYRNNGADKYNRKLKVYFSIPEKGTNEDTGLFTYISGFGGEASSNVCKKMRNNFADEFNLITIQCDYFGYEFMQDCNEIKKIKNLQEFLKVFPKDKLDEIYKMKDININEILKYGSHYNTTVKLIINLKENIYKFNDMGIMQAMDNIIANLTVMNILYENDHKFNAKKNILFGNSHGAYLCYLCNAFTRDLYSLIVDNSAWIFPQYLRKDKSRILYYKVNSMFLEKYFDYIGKDIIKDKEILNLNNLYGQFHNKCKIISYHGINDNLTNNKEKEKLCKSINNCNYNEISEKDIDEEIFKSTKHGLNADFLKLFKFTMDNLNWDFQKSYDFKLPNEISFETRENEYTINYTNIFPSIKINSLNVNI